MDISNQQFQSNGALAPPPSILQIVQKYANAKYNGCTCSIATRIWLTDYPKVVILNGVNLPGCCYLLGFDRTLQKFALVTSEFARWFGFYYLTVPNFNNNTGDCMKGDGREYLPSKSSVGCNVLTDPCQEHDASPSSNCSCEHGMRCGGFNHDRSLSEEYKHLLSTEFDIAVHMDFVQSRWADDP